MCLCVCVTVYASVAARLWNATSWWKRNQQRTLPALVSCDREQLVRGVNLKVAQSDSLKDA